MTIAQTQMRTATVLLWPGRASTSSSDETLIQRIAGGDQLAMRTLFARHQIRLFRFLVRIVRDQTVAEDLLSDVFLDVWRKAEQFEGRSSVSTWLLAIGRLKTLSTLRRRTDVVLNDEMASTIVDPADDPETVLGKKNSSEVLRRCVAALSPAHRQVIDLVYYHEKSVGEVAEIVGIPEATVKTRMFYARKQLRHPDHGRVSHRGEPIGVQPVAVRSLHITKGFSMPNDMHRKAAEHHETAAKSHRSAAEHHSKGDHLGRAIGGMPSSAPHKQSVASRTSTKESS